MASGYESHIDRQIREAQERGEFDDLPGLGKPLPDRGETYDENWWIKDLVRRENLTGLLPASLQVRKDAEGLMRAVSRKSAESSVREVVAALNERIARARQGLLDGPPVVVETFDADEVVAAWREMRAPRTGDTA
jgi:hypothetical protein